MLIPDFHFMRHDKWANVLFLHWKVPASLQDILEEHVKPFELDRTSDGSVWIGLILLTEQNVGISWLPRIAPWNSFTHHGVNVRTYVKKRPTDTYNDAGIHFASLECDHQFVSHMASYFGMPYRLSIMCRRYLKCSENSTSETREESKEEPISNQEADDVTCSKPMHRFQIISQRSTHRNSLFDILWDIVSSLWAKKRLPLHTTKLLTSKESLLSTSKDGGSQLRGTNSANFLVKCEWERSSSDTTIPDPALAKFLVERYHAYTYKYGRCLVGQVEHSPWPIEPAHIRQLVIDNVDAYEPLALQPLLAHMANHAPDSVLFSPGVGPIDFQMLRTVS